MCDNTGKIIIPRDSLALFHHWIQSDLQTAMFGDVEFKGSWLQPDSSEMGKHFTCATENVSYANRVDDPSHYNFCIVPDSAYDAVLFAAVALLVATAASVRMSALNVLLVGKQLFVGHPSTVMW